MKIPNINNIHISFGKKVVKNREIVSPVRDWFVLLCIGATTLLGLIGYGLWVYWQVAYTTYGQSDMTERAPAHLRQLEDVLKAMQNEQTEFETLNAVAPYVPDPSL